MDFFSNMEQSSTDNNEQNQNQYQQTAQPNIFSVFAKSLGIVSIFCAIFSMFYGTFVAGGLAIVLALLSKGSNPIMDNRAKLGLITGSVGVILQIVLFAASIYSIIYIPEYRQQFNAIYEQMYGESLEESLEEILKGINPNVFGFEGGNLQ